MAAQDQTIKKAEQCLNMADVRAGIDRLDRLLVALLSERQRYIERAAEIKGRRQDIRDEARITDVLAKVSAEAERVGLKVDLAQAVWRTLMEGSIAYEMQRFEARTNADV